MACKVFSFFVFESNFFVLLMEKIQCLRNGFGQEDSVRLYKREFVFSLRFCDPRSEFVETVLVAFFYRIGFSLGSSQNRFATSFKSIPFHVGSRKKFPDWNRERGF